MKLRFIFLVVVLPLFFYGCAKPPTAELQINESWLAQQTQLENLTHWSLSGKLGVFSPDGRKSVDINWQQFNQDFHIHLSGPLGITVLDIQKTANGTIIVDGEEFPSQDAEQIISSLSGMKLPISQLQQWIKGNPSGASYQLDENQQVSSLLGIDSMNGQWLINYDDYRTIKHTNLPHKLQLTHDDLRLKFSISSWNILPKQ